VLRESLTRPGARCAPADFGVAVGLTEEDAVLVVTGGAAVDVTRGAPVQFPLIVVAEYLLAVCVPVAVVTSFPGVGNTMSSPSWPLQLLTFSILATKRGG
jgi:hypothetical protein